MHADIIQMLRLLGGFSCNQILRLQGKTCLISNCSSLGSLRQQKQQQIYYLFTFLLLLCRRGTARVSQVSSPFPCSSQFSPTMGSSENDKTK